MALVASKGQLVCSVNQGNSERRGAGWEPVFPIRFPLYLKTYIGQGHVQKFCLPEQRQHEVCLIQRD